MKFKNEPIFFDENKKNQLMQPHETSIAYFQNIVDEYNNLNIGVKLKEKDLEPLIENPKKFIAERIVKEENLNFGGLKLKFETLYEMIEKPIGTDEFITQINNDKNDRYKLLNHKSTSFLEVKNGTKVMICQIQTSIFEEQSKVYLKTKSESEVFDSLNEMAKIYNKLMSYEFKEKHLKDLVFDGFIIIDFQGKATVNPYFARYIRE